MPSGKLRNAEIVDLVVGRVAEFPKYTTRIINLANQNAQGTRPRIVGQMTDLFFQERTSRSGGTGTTRRNQGR